MFGATKLAKRDECVDVPRRTVEGAGVAPSLRRPPVTQHASETLPRRAGLALVAPQHVGGTDQPVLVGRVELGGTSHSKNARSAEQGDIVEVDHVEIPQSQQPLDLPRVDDGSPELMGQQERQGAHPAAQGHNLNPIGFGVSGGRRAVAKSTERFGVVDYGHVMTSPNERLTESLDSDAIPPEVMRRIERRHVTEAKRCHRAAARLLSRRFPFTIDREFHPQGNRIKRDMQGSARPCRARLIRGTHRPCDAVAPDADLDPDREGWWLCRLTKRYLIRSWIAVWTTP